MKRLTNSERNKIVNLAKSGVSLNKLSKISGRSKSTLYYHVQNFIRKNPNVELSLLTEWERGYLLGLFFGDGNLDFRKSSYQYRVVFNFNRKTEMPIVKRLMTMLEKCGCRPYLGLFKNKANKNLARVVCLSKVLYEFLNKFVVYKKKVKGRNIVKRKSSLRNLNFSTKFLYGFLGGLLDSDGYINMKKGYSATIATASKKFVNQLGFLLEQIYIDFSIYKNKNSFILRFKTYDYKLVQNKFNSIKGQWSNGRTLPSQ